MNTDWSRHVQGVMTLYLSRKLRFDDLFFEQYEKVFRLDKTRKLKILELGCGPGALAEALKRRYPNAEITAVDRDSAFIGFAKKQIPGVTFLEADVTRLPFRDGTFDVTVSNTVQEHVEPDAFWGEQRRVLKPGGVCLCLSARKGIRQTAECLSPTPEETAFWESLSDAPDAIETYGVGRFSVSEAALPALMEAHGFLNVTTHYAVIDLTPDAPKFPPETALMMIEAERQGDLEAIASMDAGIRAVPAVAAVNRKYDERVRLYKAGEKQWDTSVSLTMILRGEKG